MGDLATSKAVFGHDVLGPLVAWFLHDLDAALERLVAQRSAGAVFVGPEGPRLLGMLQAYREAVGLPPRGGEMLQLPKPRGGGAPKLLALVSVWGPSPLQAQLAASPAAQELWGVAFGRSPETNAALGARLLTLVRSDDYDPKDPASAITRHPRLLEAIFWSPDPSDDSSLYEGVQRYVRSIPADLSYSDLLQARDVAAELLAQAILFPSRETATLLNVRGASADGETEIARAVLVEPSTSGLNAEQRIAQSAWPAGQIALECRPAIARERQQGLISARKVQAATSSHTGSPKVAVIMRTKDRLLFLQRAFEGVARQAFEDYVLVVFNDGGDIAGVQAELEASRLDRRKVILLDGGENRGMEAASNAAIAQVASDYIVIHDDDDSWHTSFLDKTVAYLDENPLTAGVVTHAYYVEDEVMGDQVAVRRRSVFNPHLSSIQLSELLVGNLYPPISFLFRRSEYEAVGGFDETLPVLGDWHFNIRMAAQGEIGIIPEPLANYHYRAAGGLYANSIVGGSNLHARYNPVVRRKISELLQQPALGAGALIAPLVADVRRLVQKTPPPASAEPLATAADDRWCMLAFARAHPDRACAMTLQDALRFAEGGKTPIPPDFDETAYLQQNPDVRELVRAGRVASGYVHFVLQGRRQGRSRPTLATGPE